jgi:hypothetical protein
LDFGFWIEEIYRTLEIEIVATFLKKFDNCLSPRVGFLLRYFSVGDLIW